MSKKTGKYHNLYANNFFYNMHAMWIFYPTIFDPCLYHKVRFNPYAAGGQFCQYKIMQKT